MTVRLCLPFSASPNVILRQKNNEYVHRKSAAKKLIIFGYLITGSTERTPRNESDKYIFSVLVR